MNLDPWIEVSFHFLCRSKLFISNYLRTVKWVWLMQGLRAEIEWLFPSFSFFDISLKRVLKTHFLFSNLIPSDFLRTYHKKLSLSQFLKRKVYRLFLPPTSPVVLRLQVLSPVTIERGKASSFLVLDSLVRARFFHPRSSVVTPPLLYSGKKSHSISFFRPITKVGLGFPLF